MHLKELRIEGFKSFGKQAVLTFPSRITGIVGPNGSGKSNIAEAFRFVLGEQSMKSMRGKRGEDLIFNGGTGASRANRAAVSVTFDNSKRALDNVFDEISISRTVYRDGTNEYSINSTQVRHRDVVELLASANIGSTGHHIISQGQADRILYASAEERKEMLEDGLGLKLLQYRRTEAEKKLQQAQKNITETDIILRETAPHLRHLKQRVERYEKASKIRTELEDLYATYLAYEADYIARKKCALDGNADTLRESIENINNEIVEEEKKVAKKEDVEKTEEMQEELNSGIQNIRTKKDAVSRTIGRIEGEQSALEALTEREVKTHIERKTIATLYQEAQDRYEKGGEVGYAEIVTFILKRLREILNKVKDTTSEEMKKRLTELQKEKEKEWEKMAALKKGEEEYICRLETLHEKQKRQTEKGRQSEKNLFTLITEKSRLEQKISGIGHESAMLREDEEQIRREIAEGAVLTGNTINRYKEVPIPPEIQNENRTRQKERRRKLERKKIELESMDTGGGEEVYREYKEVSERVDFLNREKKDLLNSIQDCEQGIQTIQKEIETRFASGVRAISSEFERFFKILFGGGKASIAIEKKSIKKEGEDPELRIGLGIQVSLPRKKITGMEQLSGGERALVSIALLFAISQITPPPFLILDETDAALDEANSQRYGNMIESLAKKSQLIVITHNRETMHRTGTLYGVTMGTTGVSTLLSVQFEDAVQVAK